MYLHIILYDGILLEYSIYFGIYNTDFTAISNVFNLNFYLNKSKSKMIVSLRSHYMVAAS